MIIYIASPYSHKDPKVRLRRYEEVVEFVAACAKKGHIVYSPIVHWHEIGVASALPTEWEFWKPQCEAMVGACGEVWVYGIEGYQKSVGVNCEVELAKESGKMVRLVRSIEEIPEVEIVEKSSVKVDLGDDQQAIDQGLLQHASEQLIEHFDTVQILCTRHEANQHDGTISCTWGLGNWFARYGQMVEFIEQNGVREGES